jgi:hypothetical protein
MNWRFFVGASILSWGLLLRAGAPLEAVALGTGLAGLACWRKARLKV